MLVLTYIMRHRPLRLAVLLASATPFGHARSSARSVVVLARSSAGTVHCSLFTGGGGFPSDASPQAFGPPRYEDAHCEHHGGIEQPGTCAGHGHVAALAQYRSRIAATRCSMPP